MQYKLKIRPSVDIELRHQIEMLLEEKGYRVTGGGQTIAITPKSESFSDISFEDKD